MRVWLLQRPVSITVAVVALAAAVATGTLVHPADPAVRALFGIDPVTMGTPRAVPALLTSVLVPSGPADALMVIVVAVLVMGAAERLLGSARTLAVYLGTAVLGTLGGIGLQELGLIAHRIAPAAPPTVLVLDPLTPIAGVVMAASAFAGPLWRRRVRLLGFAGLLVVLLYSGLPGDLYRTTAAALGLVAGMLLVRGRPALRFRRSSHHESRSLIAALVGITAVGPLVALVTHGYGVLHPVGQLVHSRTPGGRGAAEACRAAHTVAACGREFAAGGHWPAAVLTVLPLVVLAVAAFGLWRGRRAAALTAIAVELYFAVIAAVYFDLLPQIGLALLGAAASVSIVQATLSVLVPAATAATLFVALPHFAVKSGTAGRVAVRTGGIAVLAVAAANTVLSFLLRAQYSPVPSLGDLVWDLPERFVPAAFLRLRRADFVPTGPATHLLWDWTGPVAWLIVLTALVVCIATVREQARPSDVSRVRTLLRSGSRGPVAAMGLWSGNRYWFSDDGRHAVAYRVVGTIAVTLGEPVGDAEGASEAAAEFALSCDDEGLTPVFYTVSDEFAARLGQGRRWHSVVIGEDTLLDPATFAMTGKRWADVRTAVNRAAREGVRAEWTTWRDCPPSRRAQIEAISKEWAAERSLPEMGFTLGGVDELAQEDTRLMLAVGPGDRIDAVTSWLPAFRRGELVGLTLDFMRRRPRGMNGVMEFLIASVVLEARQHGLEFVSLSASPLAVSATRTPNRLDRMLAALSRLLEPAYGFKSLASFKDKFQPEVRPLVMAYPDAVSLPAIGLALTHAYLPGLSARQVLSLLESHRAGRRKVGGPARRIAAAVPRGRSVLRRDPRGPERATRAVTGGEGVPQAGGR